MSTDAKNSPASESKEMASVKKGPRLQLVDLDRMQEMPDLSKAQEIPIDLTIDYWTPEKPGENRRMIFTGTNLRETLDNETGEVNELNCAFFLEKEGEEVKTVCNGSKRLVGAFENGKIRPGTPVSITYIGKAKNKTNQYQSDTWRIKPLLIEI